MNRRELLASAAACGALTLVGPARAAADPRPPSPRRKPVRIEQLGRVRHDEYAWLKDPHWLDVWKDPRRLSPDIRAHLEAENAYAAVVLKSCEPDRRALLQAMIARAPSNSDPPPHTDGLWTYYRYLAAGADHATHARRPASGGTEQILLDAQSRTRSQKFFHIAHAAHSGDHALFAWTEDTTGAERFKLLVKDLSTGQMLPVEREDAFGDFAFSPDSKFIYWTWRDANSRPARVYRTPVRGGDDELVYEERDPGMYMQVASLASNAFVKITILNADMSEVRLIPADLASPPIVVALRRAGHFYDVDDWGDRLVVRTNRDRAVDFKLMIAFHSEDELAWREFMPHRPGRVVVDVRAHRTHVVRVERVDAKLEVIVSDRSGRDRPVDFQDEARLVSIDRDTPFEAQAARLAYETPSTPTRWLDIELSTGRRHVVRSQALNGASSYVVKRLNAPSGDGVAVPIVLVMRSDTLLDGSAPLLLYGYGSYGYTTEDEFSLANLCLADRGWIVATAHVRGGGERGRAWYEDARQMKKHNSFADFIASAEYLIKTNHTRAGRIVSYGFSAGGLLVAASANLRPDLFAGVIARAPYVDCLNTMSDAEHPLVPLARPDWGDPLVDPKAYDYIASYSPYDNVKRQAYPAVLATTAVSDNRVGYWEPAKWVARLRAHTTSSRPVLLHTNMSAGHGGSSGRLGAFEMAAELYAFALWTVGKRG